MSLQIKQNSNAKFSMNFKWAKLENLQRSHHVVDQSVGLDEEFSWLQLPARKSAAAHQELAVNAA